MFNPKVLSIFNHVEQQSSNIMKEVDAFMGNIMTWANELNEILLQEYTASKDSTRFLLPKTPCERKTRNKKTRKASASKCSTANSTFQQNETSSLDDTISTRTRAARKAATSKVSQLNFTKLQSLEESQTGSLTTEKNSKDVTESTFVLPKASKRTKPVLKSTHPEPTIPEPPRNENEVLNTSNRVSRVSRVSEKESPSKKISRTSSKTPPEGKSQQRQSSRIVSASPEEQQKVQETPIQETPTVLEETLTERPSKLKKSRTLSGGPIERNSGSRGGSTVLRSGKNGSRSLSPVNRSRSLRSGGSSMKPESPRPSRASGDGRMGEEHKVSDAAGRSLVTNETITIKRETLKGLPTIVVNETFTLGKGVEGSPMGAGERSLRASARSSGAGGADVERTPLVSGNEPDQMEIDMEENVISSTRIVDVTETENNGGATFLVGEEAETSEDVQVPKKKRKVKNDEEVKENVEEAGETVRITRTKSKAMKKMMEETETKQADLSAFAKKLINRAKMTSLKKNQLAALLECNESTPKNGPGQLGLPFGNLTASKSKYHLLLSGSKKLKTPLATLPNSAMKIVKASGDKDRMKAIVASRDSSAENAMRSVKKPSKDDLEKDVKLQSKKEKEKEAALKRQNVIKTKAEELKRKNELKHQMAMKKREKLEQEKFNLIQSEKEKEERHKILLQERQFKLKEEAYKKKMLTQQKIAETNERRRLEEEARLAKLREMEAEEQRLALEKQKEQEKQERRAQERLAQKKAQQEYEMQLKQEMEAERLRMEKLQTAKKCLASASKIQSASKRPKFEVMSDKRDWDYKPRNENDYGLENEDSEIDSEDEKYYENKKPAVPWAKNVMHGKSPFVRVLTLEMLCEFMPCYQKSPDIYKMFRMTPSKRIKRSSSAIWNTPGSKQT